MTYYVEDFEPHYYKHEGMRNHSRCRFVVCRLKGKILTTGYKDIFLTIDRGHCPDG
jgi:hypothetical protein